VRPTNPGQHLMKISSPFGFADAKAPSFETEHSSTPAEIWGFWYTFLAPILSWDRFSHRRCCDHFLELESGEDSGLGLRIQGIGISLPVQSTRPPTNR
jgi:hypothetical protein